MWQIDKRFEFCYGHRVYTQQLIGEYCETDSPMCKCRHPHGHQGAVHVFLQGESLDRTGMVTDFHHLGWLKTWIDDHIDHKFVIDQNDPMFDMMVLTPFRTYVNRPFDWETDTRAIYSPGTNNTRIVGWEMIVPEPEPDQVMMTHADQSFYDVITGFFIVDFVPTSENLSAWMCDIVARRMRKLSANIHVSRLEWFETPKSRSTYIPDLDL